MLAERYANWWSQNLFWDNHPTHTKERKEREKKKKTGNFIGGGTPNFVLQMRVTLPS